MKRLLCALALVAVAAPAFAQSRGTQLEMRVYELERQVRDLTYRIDDLERRDRRPTPPAPRPRPPVAHYCMLTDSTYRKVFLGTGTTKIDADFNARKACQTAMNPIFCSGSSVMRCDDNLTSTAFKHVCVVTDSTYGKSFRGEGETAISAEAKAKQACGTAMNPLFCSGASAKVACDAQY